MGDPMNKCHWCGKDNEAEAIFCSGCGARVAPEVIVQREVPPVMPPPIPESRPLTAGRALLVLLLFLGVQLAAGLVIGFVGDVMGALKGKNVLDPVQREQLLEPLLPYAAMLAGLMGGAGMLLASYRLVREQLHDTSPTGAAWAIGPRRGFIQGLGLGMLVALGFAVLVGLSGLRPDPESLGPLARMARTPGLPQILWLLLALAIAPPIEEMLFRGVLYGGLRRSRGPLQAAIGTTLIFGLLHITEVIHFWPGLGGILLLALAALWFRLRFAAIGPAIAVHLGYNGTIALAMLCAPAT
jgi:uncharacterized protein